MILEANIHGWKQFYMYDNNKYYIPDYSSKKQYYWCETIVCAERAKTFVDITGESDGLAETLYLTEKCESRIRRGVL